MGSPRGPGFDYHRVMDFLSPSILSILSLIKIQRVSFTRSLKKVYLYYYEVKKYPSCTAWDKTAFKITAWEYLNKIWKNTYFRSILSFFSSQRQERKKGLFSTLNIVSLVWHFPNFFPATNKHFSLPEKEEKKRLFHFSASPVNSPFGKLLRCLLISNVFWKTWKKETECVWLCVWVYICVCVWECMYVYVCVFVCVGVCGCVYKRERGRNCVCFSEK